jgi:hypothetical protein
LSIDSNLSLYLFKKLTNFRFCEFMAQKGKKESFPLPPFAVVGSRICDPGWEKIRI